MRVYIVEDDILIAEHLEQIVENSRHQLAGIAHNKEDAIIGIDITKPDIALLDIKMNNQYDGIEIGKHVLQYHSFPVIYITAHSNKEIIEKALKTKPSAYLVKPFKDSDVYTAIQIALTNYETKDTEEFIFVKDGFRTVKLLLKSILYLKSDNNYVDIHTETNKYSLRISLQEMLDSMDTDLFVRVHRSFAINKDKITKFASRKFYIKDVSIPVSRKFLKSVKELFNDNCLN